MKTIHRTLRNMVLTAISLLVIFSATPAQSFTGTQKEGRFTGEELVQMLSPIALYPDSLLAQILMASTYPLEIIEAERWLRRNKELEGDALYGALLEKDWDTSVKSLCNFPDVLFVLSDKIEQTRKLGDAFLSQEEDVMNTVQELRNRAYEQGNLKTTREQKVIIEHEIIRIEPTVGHVVYIPVYDPLYVYGRWPYPAYPPYYWYCPGYYLTSIRYIHFGSPIFISIGWFSWTWFDWPVFRIYIVINDACRYHRHFVCRDNDSYWHHDPYHRRGVDYRDRETSDRFQQNPPRLALKDPEKHSSIIGEREESPRSSVENRKDMDSPKTKSEKESLQSVLSRETATVMTRKKTEPFHFRDERNNEDKDLSRIEPEKENVQPSLSQEKSVIAIGDGYLDSKTGNRKKDKSRDVGDMELSMREMIECPSDVIRRSKTTSKRGISERGKGMEDREKDGAQ